MRESTVTAKTQFCFSTLVFEAAAETCTPRACFKSRASALSTARLRKPRRQSRSILRRSGAEGPITILRSTVDRRTAIRSV